MQTVFSTPTQLHVLRHALVSTLPRTLIAALLIVLLASAVWAAVKVMIRLSWLKMLRSREQIFLELTPQAHANRTPQAGQQLFAGLHGFDSLRSMTDKLLGRRMSFSIEMVGSRRSGIRFIFCVPKHYRDSFERSIHSFDPDIRVHEAEDYLASPSLADRKFAVFGLKRRYYPLAQQGSYEDSDPVAYLLSVFDRLQPDELVALQLVLKPARVRRAERISNRILHHQEHMDRIGNGHRAGGGGISRGLNNVLFGFTDVVGEAVHGSSQTAIRREDSIAKHHRHAAAGIRPARDMGAIETELAKQVSHKLNQPLYKVDIRAYAAGGNASSKLDGLRSSFNVYRTRYQEIAKRRIYGPVVRYQEFLMAYRLPDVLLGTSSILSVSEIASLYHFPHSGSARNGEVKKALSKALPVPVGVREKADNGELSVVLGRNEYHGRSVDIGLTQEERERHVFIVGGTGNGKTTMLFYSILQDIQAGRGVAVVDPHGDLAERVLRYIPEERIPDVVYMNPDDLEYPIGMNLLELPEGLSGNDLLREKDLITEATISVLRKVFSDNDSGGHRIEYILRNTIQTALTMDNPTLFTIFELLNDAKFRRNVVNALTDKHLIDFWQNELGKAGEFQRVKMAAGITSKIGRFLFSASAKRMFEQPKSTVDFDKLLASQKVLICNFSKGLLGEDTSALFGTTILAKLQTAALRRARLSEGNRTPYYLYVDEFQNFATLSFVQMLSEARKYKLLLTMAEQSTAQQEQQRLVHIILANVGTVICFRSGSPADEALVPPLFMPYLQPGEIANLPAYSFYARISAMQAQEPMSGVTLLVDGEGEEKVAKRVVRSSRRQYASRYGSKDKAIIIKEMPDDPTVAPEEINRFSEGLITPSG